VRRPTRLRSARRSSTTSASTPPTPAWCRCSCSTVGPGSSLVIDKFVYDPNTGAGELAASFTKGALRFVAGKLSKTEPDVKVKTPAGTLTVRGGIFQGIMQSANQAVFAFVFGHYLSLDRHGRRYMLNQTGNLFYVRGPGAPVMRQTTQGNVNIILAAVSGRSVTVGGRVHKIKGQAWPFYYGIQPSAAIPTSPSSASSITTAPSTRSFTACRKRSSCRTCMTGGTTGRACNTQCPRPPRAAAAPDQDQQARQGAGVICANCR
jgi:hypothetical protein